MNAPLVQTRGAGRILPDLTQLPITVPRDVKTEPRKAKRIDDAEMRQLFEAGLDDAALANHFGYGVGTIREHRWAIGLMRRSGRVRGAANQASPRSTFISRHAPEGLGGKIARMPAYDHPALTEARTLYPRTVVPVRGLRSVLVGGDNSWKIGALVTKGRWRGYPIYTLTLEERAACPTSCAHWRSCYGNAMHLAKRVAHGPEFESRLKLEVAVLASRHPGGFAVRLHVLGDFYSVGYVSLWRELIERYANLHVFGFTARTDPADPITHALHDLVLDHWPRGALRFSNAPTPILSTVTIEHPLQKPADAILCPQQTGRTASCGTCALCWSSERRIAFLRH